MSNQTSINIDESSSSTPKMTEQNHNKIESCDTVMTSAIQINEEIENQSDEEITYDRAHLEGMINSVRTLATQGFYLHMDDELLQLIYDHNLIKLINHIIQFSKNSAELISENDPTKTKNNVFNIHKNLLNIWMDKIRSKIREEIGVSKVCIIVDEACTESIDSDKNQVSLVLRFVDQEGFVKERFFGNVDIKDITGLDIKEAIQIVLSSNSLSIQDIRGQGYDGNFYIRNELHTSIFKDCPYAYYTHCTAHRFDLALIASLREPYHGYFFFKNLNFIVNIVSESRKISDELKEAQVNEFAHLIANSDIEHKRGGYHIDALKKDGYNSHFTSICSFERMFGEINSVLEELYTNGPTYNVRGDAENAYEMITFEFVFILHLMKQILGITDMLCKALQNKTQDLSNLISCVCTTKKLLHDIRENGYDTLINNVKLFCEKEDIEIQDMNELYKKRTGREITHITFEQFYKIDIFKGILDSIISELDRKFGDEMIELLTLVSCLDPRNGFELFNSESILSLVDKFYPKDFTVQERDELSIELLSYKSDVCCDNGLKDVLTISELCRGLVVSGKLRKYPLIYRIISLVLTLPIFSADIERAFYLMKTVKKCLKNEFLKGDEFMSDYLLIYMEKEIAEKFSLDMLIDTIEVE